MPQRLLQVVLPAGFADEVEPLLEGRSVDGRWADSDRLFLHIHVSAEGAEEVIDSFVSAFSSTDGFHALLLPVEASLPRPDEDEGDDDDEQTPEPPPEKKTRFRLSRDELYDEITQRGEISRAFVALTLLSAAVAAVGLLRDDIAVVIGAMVIAPLMGPNVLMAFATTLGDTSLFRKAIRANLTGVSISMAVAVLVGLFRDIDPAVPSIASRTVVSGGDIVLALAAASAGTLALTTGLPTALIGVMVAVALLPPLVVFGMLLGDGDGQLALRALLLVACNVICINLAGVATLWWQGVHPRTWWEAEKAKRRPGDPRDLMAIQESIGELEENHIGSNCGQHIMNYMKSGECLEDGYTYAVQRPAT